MRKYRFQHWINDETYFDLADGVWLKQTRCGLMAINSPSLTMEQKNELEKRVIEYRRYLKETEP